MPATQLVPYNYRRRLPHYQKDQRTLFITFRKLTNLPFPEEARSLVLQHCLHDHQDKYLLHAAVVMPEHVHLLLSVLSDPQGYPFRLALILKLIKGTSAYSVNKLLGQSGPVWQDESFDHVLRSEEHLEDRIEYIRQNPVRRSLVQIPEDYPWLWIGECGADTLVRSF